MSADDDIHAERVAVMLRQTPIAVVVTVINAFLMTALLISSRNELYSLAWFAVVKIVAAGRLMLWDWHRKAVPVVRQANTKRWARLGTLGAAAAGAVWGFGAVWLWPQEEAYQLLWVFLIGGMCAGAAAIHNTHLPSALLFILLAGVPITVKYAATASTNGWAAAGMVMVYLAAMVIISRRASTQFTSNVRLRMNFERLAQELNASNTLLKQEMAEHRVTEASLRQAQKMEALGQLTGGIAHDFNNLLTVVLSNLTLLRQSMPADAARAARYADTAYLGAQRGAALTQRLLTFGRRQTLRPEATDLATLVDGTAGLLRNAIGQGINLVTRLPVNLPPVFVDANQLELALLNLAVNARDAMPSGGTLTITASAPTSKAMDGSEQSSVNSHVVLSVADTGQGMDEATLAKATEPFFTTKEVGKGTGLGLSMVHGFATQSGGTLLLHSAMGQGTSVEIWLPSMSPETVLDIGETLEDTAATAPVAAQALSKLTVLDVDDDELVLSSTASMLEYIGHQVIEAGSGDEALAVIAGGEAIDLVITDQGMPGMTGLQVAEVVRQRWPELPVMLCTGYQDEDRGYSGMFLLAKPFGQEQLAQAVEACVTRETARS
jgi:signal transduction histidine kinase